MDKVFKFVSKEHRERSKERSDAYCAMIIYISWISEHRKNSHFACLAQFLSKLKG